MRWLLTLLALVCLGSACKPAEAVQVREEPSQAVAMSESYALVWREDSRAATSAPLSLTASDGTGLELRKLEVRGVVEDPLAFTELRMLFHNPENRQREGRFEIELPPGAVISRLSMRIGSEMQEAEMVELKEARIAYEQILHQRRDPALLEQDAGNRFRARVFPIPARADKEIVISYTQQMRHSAEPYRVPLRGLSEMDRLDVDVVVRGEDEPEHLRFELAHVKPEHDIEVAMPQRKAAVGLRHGNLAMARVKIEDVAQPEPVHGLTVLFDTSASRGAQLRTQVERLSEVIEGLLDAQGEDFQLAVIAFDQEVEPLYRGPATGFDWSVQGRLVAREARGASDLGAALDSLRHVSEGNERVLLVSDGIATAGERRPDQLREAVARLDGAGIRRLDVLVTGNLRDDELLGRMVTPLERAGAVIDAGLTAEAMVGKLTHAVYSGARVDIPGATWVWPERLDSVQPGDQRLVFAELPAGEPMRVELDGVGLSTGEIDMRSTERPLLERARVGAEIARTVASGQPGSREHVIELSKRHRVMSPYTALLVLETDADYRRFDIDRHALADIAVVGENGVELLNRSIPRADQPFDPYQMAMRFGEVEVQPEEDADEEASGTGQRHKGEEGKMGKPTSRSRSGLYSMRGSNDVIPQLGRNFDPDMTARQAGILGTMEQESGHFLASPYGGGFAVGNDDEDVWGGVPGSKVGAVFGVGGLGLVGTGRGGGGVGEGTIGLGNDGLIGKGGGGGTGAGYGRGSGAGFGGRGKRIPAVRQAKARVQGDLDRDIIRRIQRAHINEVRHCYNQGLVRNPNLKGRVRIAYTITPHGKVGESKVESSTLRDASVSSCIQRATRRWRFPKPRGGGIVRVTMPWELTPGPGVRLPEPRRIRRSYKRSVDREADSPWEGRYAEVMVELERDNGLEALNIARAWVEESPTDVLALLALGEALEATGDRREAARVYGSLIDLFPSRAEMRRLAGERLARLGDNAASLALDSFGVALEQRADHPSSHRLYAFALARAGEPDRAFEVLEGALKADYAAGRFPGVHRVLREDLGLVAAAWSASSPEDAEEIGRRTRDAGARIAKRRSTRFVLHWETDRSDIDLHVRHKKQHASYRYMGLESGGDLYNDVRSGYGPEAFVLKGRPRAGAYELEARIHERGPGGYGLGSLQILSHDGKGGLSFEERPFVIQTAGGKVSLGEYRA